MTNLPEKIAEEYISFEPIEKITYTLNLLIDYLKEKELHTDTVKEKWVPKEGELYWFVDTGFEHGYGKTTFNHVFAIDRKRIETNNYFKTEEQAKEAATLVLEALKKAHE